jgi:hypothetical protein
MSIFAGILRIEDTSTALTTLDPTQIAEVMPDVLAKYVEERNAAQGLFVEAETTEYKERYRAGGYDEGQEIGPDGRPLETYVGGAYDVAYPLERFGWAYGWNEETYAAMTVADLDRETDAKLAGNARRHMRSIFRALLRKGNYTVIDDLHGEITVRRLANGDGTLYPPTANGDTEADDNHYLTSGYAPGAMSSTNNPLVLGATEAREHFSSTSRIVAFINGAQRGDFLTRLPNFEDAKKEGIQPGSADAQAIDPNLNVPGDFLGVDGDSGVYVYVYDRVPATYILMGAVDEAKPLKRRVPRFITLQGFTVRAEEAHFPFYKKTWIERFGYGVGNRLGWVAIELTADPTYDDPTSI